MLQHVIIPCFRTSFDSGHGEELIGSPAAPDQDNPDNVISAFINKVCTRHTCNRHHSIETASPLSSFSPFQVIDPENPFGTSDAMRILLLQFSSLLVERASPHIHDAANKFVHPLQLSPVCIGMTA